MYFKCSCGTSFILIIILLMAIIILVQYSETPVYLSGYVGKVDYRLTTYNEVSFTVSLVARTCKICSLCRMH